MPKDYYLDPEQLKAKMAERGFSNLSAFTRAAGVHRNTLLPYLSGRKSVFTAAVEKIGSVLDVDILTLVRGREARMLTESTGKALKKILEGFASSYPSLCFMLIGSRARGKARPYSDWDIAISGGREKIASTTYLKLKAEIEDATENLPNSVDVVNLDAAPPWFLADLKYLPQFLTGNHESYSYILGVLDGIRAIRED